MSKITNWFVDNFGGDKVMHFLGGAWITAVLSVYGWYGIIAGVIFVFIISFIKEQFLDSTFDKNDINAALLGSAASAILFGMTQLIGLLF